MSENHSFRIFVFKKLWILQGSTNCVPVLSCGPSSASQNLLIDELENLRLLSAPGILHLLGAMPTQEYNRISLAFEKVQLGSLHRYIHETPVQDLDSEI